MKINLEIDLEELYVGSEQSLTEAIERKITNEVTKVVWEKLEERITKFTDNEVRKTIEEKIGDQMSLYIDNFIKEGKVKSSRDSSKLLPIDEWIREKMEYDSGYNTIRDLVQRQAKGFADEMKKRFDLLFASQLVAKMSENGLLKEDVAKLLLSETLSKP